MYINIFHYGGFEMGRFKYLSVLVLVFFIMGCSNQNVQIADNGYAVKPSIILFTSDNCANCEEQEQYWNEIKEEQGEDTVYNFIEVNVRDPYYADVLKQFEIDQIPTIVTVSTDAQRIQKKQGVHNKKVLKKTLEDMFDYEVKKAKQ